MPSGVGRSLIEWRWPSVRTTHHEIQCQASESSASPTRRGTFEQPFQRREFGAQKSTGKRYDRARTQRRDSWQPAVKQQLKNSVVHAFVCITQRFQNKGSCQISLTLLRVVEEGI